MLRRGLAIVCALGLALLGACAGKGNMVRGVAHVPVEEAIASDSAQKRTLPWDKLVLTASTDYARQVPDGMAASEGITPGLWAGGARLKARDAATLDLSRQLAKLPASEAPPGESRELNLEQFASRRPELNAMLREKLRAAVKEEVQNPDAPKAQLTLTLPLRDIAQAVLDQGGGFRPDQAMTTALGPRARAQAAAKSQAEQALMRDLLTRSVDGKTTFAQWADQSPDNRAKILRALAQAHVVRSQEMTKADGTKEWVHEVELDAAALEAKGASRGKKGRKSDGDKMKPMTAEEKQKILEGYAPK